MHRTLILLLLAVMTAAAADVTGAWKGTVDTPNGSIDISANLKADGNTVTGTLTAMGNDQTIAKGKLDADKISFEITGEMGTLVYAGTVNGDEMKLSLTVMGNEIPIVLKRVKP